MSSQLFSRLLALFCENIIMQKRKRKIVKIFWRSFKHPYLEQRYECMHINIEINNPIDICIVEFIFKSFGYLWYQNPQQIYVCGCENFEYLFLLAFPPLRKWNLYSHSRSFTSKVVNTWILFKFSNVDGRKLINIRLYRIMCGAVYIFCCTPDLLDLQICIDS